MNTGARLLYVDDDEGLRRLVTKALSRRGYVVASAGDGLDGLRMAGDEAYDVIALDHFMPGLDGLETLTELGRTQPDTPIVYVTGSEDSRIAVSALKAGATDYVIKTAGDDFLDLLASAADQALEKVRLRREKAAVQAALQTSNAQLAEMVERQAVLLREVNHRVANSLQLVSALIHMQASTVDDPAAKAALIDTQNRVQAISQVHSRLYTSDDVESVEMEDYLAALLGDLEETCSSNAARRTLRLAAEPMRLTTDMAVSVGVIVAELIINACKYAYPADRPGDVRVELRRTAGGEVQLTVEDDGPGFHSAEPTRGSGIGQKVIRAMAANLRSTVTIDPAHAGVRAVLLFQA